MNRNTLYFVLGLLVAGVAIAGYLYYQESRSGIELKIGGHGVKIEGN